LIRVRTKTTVAELEKIFEAIFSKVERESEQPKELDADFTTAAEEELDKLFGF
jgi:hypothetical protein